MDSLGFSIIAKTGKQQQIKIPISGREVLQPFTWYTCPAGKRAICKGNVKCTGRGAAGLAIFSQAGVQAFVWNRISAASADSTYILTPDILTTGNGGQTAFFDVELAAGEFIQTSQDIGTNAEFELFMEVLELPV